MAVEPKRVPIPRHGVDYRGKVVLAPMVRSGELPTRLVALKYGADLVWGPETVDKAMIGTTRRYNPHTQIVEWAKMPQHNFSQLPDNYSEQIIYRLHAEREKGRLIFQMGTADPDLAVQAARTFAADVAGIDVNAGCPKPFSTKGGMGAALLKDPDKLCRILEALVGNIMPEYEIGISVKIRLLEDPADTAALVRRLCATGITGLTVHCRTTPMRPREPAIRAQLSMIADICHDAGVACLMNGDVDDRDHAMDLARQYGVDGAMIARAAERNPTCFRAQADGGPLSWDAMAGEYVRTAMEVEHRLSNTKYLLGVMVPGKAPHYSAMQRCRSYTELCEAFGMDAKAMRLADERDRAHGLGVYAQPKKKRPAKGDDQAAGPAKTARTTSAAVAELQPVAVRVHDQVTLSA